MIMTKLFIQMAEPNNKKKIILHISIAGFLILRDCVYCNNSLPHLQAKIKPHILKIYKEFYNHIKNIYEMLDSDEVKTYWSYIKDYKSKDSMLQ
jgi:hypothetical protein